MRAEKIAQLFLFKKECESHFFGELLSNFTVIEKWALKIILRLVKMAEIFQFVKNFILYVDDPLICFRKQILTFLKISCAWN